MLCITDYVVSNQYFFSTACYCIFILNNIYLNNKYTTLCIYTHKIHIHFFTYATYTINLYNYYLDTTLLYYKLNPGILSKLIVSYQYEAFYYQMIFELCCFAVYMYIHIYNTGTHTFFLDALLLIYYFYVLILLYILGNCTHNITLKKVKQTVTSISVYISNG